MQAPLARSPPQRGEAARRGASTDNPRRCARQSCGRGLAPAPRVFAATVDWLTPRDFAAAVVLPARATARKCFRSFQSNTLRYALLRRARAILRLFCALRHLYQETRLARREARMEPIRLLA